jgi:hypothetical protein
LRESNATRPINTDVWLLSWSGYQQLVPRDALKHVDQIEELPLHINAHVNTLVDTLAWALWQAFIHLNDGELLLAPANLSLSLSISTVPVFKSALLGDHIISMLDCNYCRDMGTNDSGVDHAVDAFYRNTYYPRP